MPAVAPLATLALWVGGCGAPPGSSAEPSEAVRAYAAALRAGDADTAFELLTRDQQLRTSRQEVAHQLEASREELRELADELAATAPSVRAEARVPLADGGAALLVWEDGAFRLSGNLLGMPRLRTPLEAVAALRQALERQSLRGVEQVLSRARRAALRAEIDGIVDETSDELDLTVEIEGNRARIRTTGGRELLLVRELGEWHVAEIR